MPVVLFFKGTSNTTISPFLPMSEPTLVLQKTMTQILHKGREFGWSCMLGGSITQKVYGYQITYTSTPTQHRILTDSKCCPVGRKGHYIMNRLQAKQQAGIQEARISKQEQADRQDVYLNASEQIIGQKCYDGIK